MHQFTTSLKLLLVDIIIYIKHILQRQMSQEEGITTLTFPFLRMKLFIATNLLL